MSKWKISKGTGLKFDPKFERDQHLAYVYGLKADFAFYQPHSALLHYNSSPNMFRADGNMYYRLPTDRPGPITLLSPEQRQKQLMEQELMNFVAQKWGSESSAIRTLNGTVMLKYGDRVIEMSANVYDNLVLHTSAKDVKTKLQSGEKP